jgi:probable HAF family extracellular repeat protein
MRKQVLIAGFAATLAGLVALPAGAKPPAPAGPPALQFVAIDLGTLGGPNAYPNTPGRSVSESGTFVGSAETTADYPYQDLCPGCHVSDAFEWRNGVMTDLGTTGGSSSGLFEENDAGIGVGFSETGPLDPQSGNPVAHAAISKNGHMVDLGTLGGYQSWALSINNRGQVAGFAANTIPDATAGDISPYGSATQVHAVLWQGGVAHDIGTLGGPNSQAFYVDDQGQVGGWSATNSTLNDATGLPTMDPFLWEHGRMRDLGGLGGVIGYPMWMNNHGEMAGWSDLPGDQTSHPVLWDGHRAIDLGTLGGDNGFASWVNEAGDVVGSADLPGSQTHDGFLWKHGKMQALPPPPGDPCSNAEAVNARDQAVGNATDCQNNELAAMFWDHGKAYDLNDLIGNSPLYLIEAYYINNRGEIAAVVSLPDGAIHLALLVPAPLAAQEGLAPTALAPAGLVAAPATIRDPRDGMDSIRGRLASLPGISTLGGAHR